MALYESNYLRLLRLLPEIDRLDGCFRSRVAGDCDLHVEIIETSRYTVTLSLTYHLATDHGLLADPDMTIRVYLDGQQAEVLAIGEQQRHAALRRLVFVEDYTPVTQYAQSLKLTSLGRLTASIAHEIRNPLGAISHAAQLLQESPDLSAGDQRMADIIQHHCVRVNQIVESVMQISRREPPKPEYIMLSDWLNEFVSSYLKALNRPSDISIECDYRELLVEFDPENLQRVLANLLDNALRHSAMATGRETARIVVSLDFTAHQCLIDIIDTGNGVPHADQAKLFEPFYTTVEAGSGMGLYLCKELCEINNADLSYRPTSAGESCFRISLNQRAL